MSSAELLEDALAELRTRGWHQGAFEDEKGAVCLLGALRRAHLAHNDGGDYTEWWTATHTLGLVVQEQYGDGGIGLVNDNKLTEQYQAEALLEKAIVKAQEQEGLS